MEESGDIKVKKNKKQVDMCTRPLLGKIIWFSLPLIATGILQLLYNAADIIVVGQFSGHTAMAAVGSTGSLVNLVTNLFIGLSVGALSAMSRWIGAGEKEKADKVVHTSIPVGLIGGIIVGVIGFFGAEFFLELMKTDANVIGQATLYLKIYFVGMPFSMLYNFGAAILRAVGDTQRPLYFLLIAGVINVLLNLLFVIVFHMGVEGVAIPTVISQCVSATLVLLCLVKSDAVYRVNLKELHIYKEKLLQMIKIGVPAGIQSATFSISNVLIQSSINSFGALAMAGNTAASNIEGFVSTAQDAFSQAALSFTGQNVGAGQTKRVNRILPLCAALVLGVGLALGSGAYLLGNQLLSIYSSDPEVIAFGMKRMAICCVLQCVGGLMGVMVGTLRGMGYSFVPMAITIGFVCGFRVIWIFTIFVQWHTLESLYVSYPITWGLAALCDLICFFFVRKHLTRKQRLARERAK